jgi:hypothetical protein
MARDAGQLLNAEDVVRRNLVPLINCLPMEAEGASQLGTSASVLDRSLYRFAHAL